MPRCVHAAATGLTVQAAIEAAHEAFKTWRLTPPFERARLIRKAADIMREHAEELALLDTYNTGNPIREMCAQIMRCWS